MMKKTTISVITLILLCTMCIGLVACNENIPTLPAIGTITLFNFAKENTFSFGTFEVGERIGYVNRANGERYVGDSGEATATAIDPEHYNQEVLLWQDDERFDEMVNALQNLYSANIEDYITERSWSEDPVVANEIRELALSDYIERKKIALDSAWCHKSTEYFLSNIENTNEGEKFNEIRFIKKKLKGNYEIVYFIYTDSGKMLSYSDNKIDNLDICFGVYVVDKERKTYARINAKIEMFWYREELASQGNSAMSILMKETEPIGWMFDNAPTEQLYESGKSYFEDMEEVIFAWLDDPRGQAYINKYYS